MMNEISIVIPSYKEYENLDVLIPKLIFELESHQFNYEILIIDSFQSLDQTLTLSQKYNIIYKNREVDNTYSSAVKTGMKYARYQKILFMDADGSHSPAYIIEMYRLSAHYDVVIGSRYIKDGSTRNNFLLVLMSKVLNAFYSLLFKLKVSDISNSFKIYPLEKLKALDLECKHFDIIEEILIKLRFQYPDMTIFETPITFNKRIYGKSKRSFIVFVYSYFKTMIKLYQLKLNLRK